MVSAGAEIDYPPFSIQNQEDQADGFSIELMRAALQAMGREVTFRVGPWHEVRGWLESGEVDALPLVGRTPEREDLFDFTFPYLTLHGSVVVRKGTTGIESFEDLRRHSVAVMRGDNMEEFLRRDDRAIEIHTTETFEEALQDLSAGHYDAVVIQRLVALRLIQESGLRNLHVLNKPIEGFRQDFCFAVREGDKKMLEILNEGLALMMADGTYRRLHTKWFATMELPTARTIIVGGDWNYPPFEFLDERGRPAGYNVDLTRAIAQELGLEIEIVLGPWDEIRDGLANGEIDAVQGMFYSIERDLQFDFTQAHTVNHCVSVVRRDSGPPPTTAMELRGKRIAVQRGDILHDYAVGEGLDERLFTVESQEDALEGVMEGRYDCALVARMTALYWIEKHGWDGLVVADRALVAPEYCYAVPHNRKVLISQLSEGLRILDETGEYRRIHEKWMGVYDPSPPSPAAILRYIAWVAVPLLIVLLASVFWLWSLRKEVASRTQALQRSESQFRSLIEGAPDAVFVQTEQRYAYLNSAAVELFGAQSANQLISHSVLERVEVSKRPALNQRISEMNREKKDVPLMEEEWLRLDGGTVPVEVAAVPIHYEGKDGALVFARDITERKRIEAEREQLLLAIEQAADIIVVTDPQLTIQYVNPAFERATGYSREEAIGSHPRFLQSEQNGEAFYREVRETISQGKIWQGRLTQRRKEGSLLLGEMTASPVYDARGHIVNYVAVARDITHEEELEERLRQAQKMESIGRLAGGVAHDFNNMLGVIIGYLELAMEKIEPGQPIYGDLQEIQKAARRSAELTGQLLAFARRQTVQPEVIDLNETVADTLNMLQRLIGENIELVWKPEADLWTIRMDPSQINQILANLAVNARDAIDGMGRMVIETRNVEIEEPLDQARGAVAPGEYVVLSVSDDGAGMDARTLANIFEPFFTTKPYGEGTGLGLAMIYGMVKQNDGFINVYSESGEGTTFTIYLPRFTDNKAVRRSIPEYAPRQDGRETILLVEDEGPLLKLSERLLKNLGYQVLSAATPAEAIEIARDHCQSIDLLFTDVVMPEMNGKELHERISEHCPGIKALFMSGYTADIIARHGVLEDGVYFLQKPFSMQTLATKLRESLKA